MLFLIHHDRRGFNHMTYRIPTIEKVVTFAKAEARCIPHFVYFLPLAQRRRFSFCSGPRRSPRPFIPGLLFSPPSVARASLRFDFSAGLAFLSPSDSFFCYRGRAFVFRFMPGQADPPPLAPSLVLPWCSGSFWPAPALDRTLLRGRLLGLLLLTGYRGT